MDGISPPVSGLLRFLYWVLLTKAIETSDLSLVYPIMRSSPALVLLFSMFVLNEAVSPCGVAWILLVALGSYTINMQRLSVAEMVRLLRAISNDRAIQFAFLTLVSVASSSIVNKVAVGLIHPSVFAYGYPFCWHIFDCLRINNPSEKKPITPVENSRLWIVPTRVCLRVETQNPGALEPTTCL